MESENSLRGLRNALAFGVSLTAAEHFISAGMSSPWSVAKFAKTPEDEAMVWKLFTEAAIASIVSAAVLGLLLRDKQAFFWSVAGAVSVMIFVGSEYKRALNGTL